VLPSKDLFTVGFYLAFPLKEVQASVDIALCKLQFLGETGDRGFRAVIDYLAGLFPDFFGASHMYNGLNKAVEKGFMDDPEDMIEELEKDIGEIEHDFDEVKNEGAEGTLREKQEKAEDILEEIHGQLKFLKEQVEDTKK